MVIRFRRKRKAEWMTLFVLAMPFFFFWLMNVFHLPSLVKYTIDVAWAGLLLIMLNRKDLFLDRHTSKFAMVAGLFFAFTLVGFLLNYQSALYYLWGMRNNVRFFIFFFACIFFLNEKSIKNYVKCLDGVFWLNLPIVLYQFFMLGKAQDYLGGIFGTEQGCNGYVNILMLIVVTRSILNFLNQKESLKWCFLKCAVALVVAVLSELKVFFLEFALIVVMAMNITKASYKKMWLGIYAVIGIYSCIQIIGILFPEFAEWFTLERIWETVTSTKGYTSSNDMNRLTTVSIAMSRFLSTTTERLFGLGLGNCDYASFDFLITPFYRSYRALNYVWFSSAFLILETGLVGLFLYTLFFVMVYFEAKKKMGENAESTEYEQLTMIMAVLCVVLMIYNVSLRTEAGFMMYFTLALPFISSKKG